MAGREGNLMITLKFKAQRIGSMSLPAIGKTSIGGPAFSRLGEHEFGFWGC